MGELQERKTLDIEKIQEDHKHTAELVGCADHSCLYAPPPAGSMGTNGGCRCPGSRPSEPMPRVLVLRLIKAHRQRGELLAELSRLRQESVQLRREVAQEHHSNDWNTDKTPSCWFVGTDGCSLAPSACETCKASVEDDWNPTKPVDWKPEG